MVFDHTLCGRTVGIHCVQKIFRAGTECEDEERYFHVNDADSIAVVVWNPVKLGDGNYYQLLRVFSCLCV